MAEYSCVAAATNNDDAIYHLWASYDKKFGAVAEYDKGFGLKDIGSRNMTTDSNLLILIVGMV